MIFSNKHYRSAVSILILISGLSYWGQRPLLADSPDVDFATDVKPILQKNCLPCHNASVSEGDVILESEAQFAAVVESGPIVLPGKHSESLLWKLSSGTDEPLMPPDDNDVGAVRLDAAQLEILARWIDGGAKWSQQSIPPSLAWIGLPAQNAPIHAAAISRDSTRVAAAWGNQALVMRRGSGKIESRLVDPDLMLPGADSKIDAAAIDYVQSIAFSPDGDRVATGSFRTLKIWQAPQATSIGRFSPAPDGAMEIIAGTEGLVARLPDQKIATRAWRDPAWTIDSAEPDAVSPSPEPRVDSDPESGKTLGTTWILAENRYVKPGSDGKQPGTSIDFVAAAIRFAAEASALDLTVQQRNKSATEADLAEAKKNLEAEEANLVKLAEESTKAADAVLAAKKAAEEKPDDEMLKAKIAETEGLAQSAREAHQRAEIRTAEVREQFFQWEANVATRQTQLTQAESINAARQAAAAALEASNIVVVASPTGDRILTITASGTAAILDEAGLPILTFSCSLADQSAGEQSAGEQSDAPQSLTLPIAGAAWVGDGQIVAWQSDGSASMWNIDRDWKLERTIGSLDSNLLQDRVLAISWSPDGKKIACGAGEPSRGGQVTIWESDSGQLVAELESPHSDSVMALAYSPDGSQLATAAADRMAKVWDTATGALVRTLEGHTHHVTSISWRCDSHRVATASADTTVKVWLPQDGSQKRTIDLGEKELMSVGYWGTDDLIAVSGGIRDTMLYNGEDGNSKGRLAGSTDYTYAVAASVDGQWIITGSRDGLVKAWNAKQELQWTVPLNEPPPTDAK